nr:immunoglobulin heavy chain junction region [Macaca mulatta]MOY21477.1 immunoglobulin heavy chain junction region [Macaca mulatta]MOY21741.1 immunoglobulin heavy chain junction region [Macaca mulatta]MOY21762.1 immunoglobulin heavy chain junction region [Macaca mulatta]MOY21765.1 immunoglobulin heavy chain junction region [Macaca mulatta]
CATSVATGYFDLW